MQTLVRQLPEGQIVVTGNGSACVVSFQAAELASGQRLWTNSGCASMGYDLPAAIGAIVPAASLSSAWLATDRS